VCMCVCLGVYRVCVGDRACNVCVCVYLSVCVCVDVCVCVCHCVEVYV